MVRGLKFRILEVEGLHYLCSENKGADQLRGNRKADLCLCFRICNKPVFSWFYYLKTNLFHVFLFGISNNFTIAQDNENIPLQSLIKKRSSISL